MYIPFLDDPVNSFLILIRSPFVTFVSLVITYSGGLLVANIMAFLSLLSFLYHHRYHRIVPLLVTVYGTALSIVLLKYTFDLERPGGALYLESSPSFPSGHAALAMAHFGFIVYVLWKHDSHHLRNPLILSLCLLILLVGLSRLYLGVHFVADVIVGFMIGLIWIIVGIRLSHKHVWYN